MILFDSYLKHYGFSNKEYVEGDKNNFTCELSTDRTFEGRFINSFGDFTTITGRWGDYRNMFFWFRGNAKGYKHFPAAYALSQMHMFPYGNGIIAGHFTTGSN